MKKIFFLLLVAVIISSCSNKTIDVEVSYLDNEVTNSGDLDISYSKTINSKSYSKNSVIVYEYSDFQCPYCGLASNTLHDVAMDNTDVLFVFKHFPLDFHEHAFDASVSAECASEQNKFWSMHDSIFKNQSKISRENFFLDIANSIGLDMDIYNQCIINEDIKTKIKNDIVDGKLNGVNGTPTYIIKGPNGVESTSGYKQENKIKELIQKVK